MSDYIAFSPDYVYGTAWNLRTNIGAITSITLYIFLLMLCIIVIADVINRLL